MYRARLTPLLPLTLSASQIAVEDDPPRTAASSVVWGRTRAFVLNHFDPPPTNFTSVDNPTKMDADHLYMNPND